MTYLSCQQTHVCKFSALNFFFQGTKHTATNKQGFTPHGSNVKTPAKPPSRAEILILPPPSWTQLTRRPCVRSVCWDCASFWFMCFWPCCSPGNSSRASGSGAARPMCGRPCGSCGRRSRECFRRVCWQGLMGVIPTNPFISRCVALRCVVAHVFFSLSSFTHVVSRSFCSLPWPWLGLAGQARAQLLHNCAGRVMWLRRH